MKAFLLICFCILMGNLAYAQVESDSFSSDSMPAFNDSISQTMPSDSIQIDITIPLRSEDDTLFAIENPRILFLSKQLALCLSENSKDYILSHTPTFEDYLKFIDSSDANKSSDVVKGFKHKVFKSTLNKQYKRMRKDADYLKVNLRRSEVRKFFYEHGIHPDYDREFCYINLELKKGKTDFLRIQILALKMGDNWYFADDLSLMVVKQDKGKR